MDCLHCKNLEDALASRLSQYFEARFTAYYQVSTELAAKKRVDMERARIDLQEHQLVCAFGVELRPSGRRAIGAVYANQEERLRPGTLRLAESPNLRFASADWST